MRAVLKWLFEQFVETLSVCMCARLNRFLVSVESKNFFLPLGKILSIILAEILKTLVNHLIRPMKREKHNLQCHALQKFQDCLIPLGEAI